VLRSQAGLWPPVGQPRLPVAATAVNTLVLVLSAVALALGARAPRARRFDWLAATWLLGAAFVALQGWEWVRLIGFGLTTASGVYGSLFFALIGTHGLHVLGALLALGLAARAERAGRTDEGRLQATRLFWFFVVALWPILYVLVYLW
jgi:heme/copper-type cytochrome/quinol oxidase subunit 3